MNIVDLFVITMFVLYYQLANQTAPKDYQDMNYIVLLMFCFFGIFQIVYSMFLLYKTYQHCRVLA